MSKSLVCFVETSQHDNNDEKLLFSLNRLGIPSVAFGKGEKWNGWIHRLEILLDGIKKYQGKYDYILHTDARDVLYYKGLDEIVSKYETIFKPKGTKILFNAETNCYPNKLLKPAYPYQDKKYRYLNAGCFIAEIDFAVEFFTSVINRAHKERVTDDQEMLSMMYIEHYNLFKEETPFRLDIDCEIFQVLWDEEWGRSANFDIVYNRDRIYNRLTNTDPCIFHAPGPTTTLSQVWKIINNKWIYNPPEKKSVFFEKKT